MSWAVTRGLSCGRGVRDPGAVGGAGFGAARPRPCGPGDGVIRLAAAHPEKSPASAGPHRHLRPDGQVPEAAGRRARAGGGPGAQRTAEAGAGRPARTPVPSRARPDPAQVPTREGAADPRDLRASALGRARAPHREAAARRRRPCHRYLPPLSQAPRIARFADRLVGHRSRQLQPRDRAASTRQGRAGETVRVRGAGGRAGAGTQAIPGESGVERHGHAAGARVPEKPPVQRPAPHRPLLLPRATELERPAALSNAVVHLPPRSQPVYARLPVQPTTVSRWRALLGDVHLWIPLAVLMAGLLVLRWIA